MSTNSDEDWEELDPETRKLRALEIDLISLSLTEPDKWSHNEAVYLAFGNVRAGAAAKLIALMRSGEEIHPIVREAIAQAVEDGLNGRETTNVRLLFKGDNQRSHGAKIAKRQQYVQVAQHYENLMAASQISSTDALRKTADEVGAPFDVATVDASITYYRNMLEATQHIQDAELRAIAEHQFHLDDLDPKWRERP